MTSEVNWAGIEWLESQPTALPASPEFGVSDDASARRERWFAKARCTQLFSIKGDHLASVHNAIGGQQLREICPMCRIAHRDNTLIVVGEDL
jgi:hypothetical protein